MRMKIPDFIFWPDFLASDIHTAPVRIRDAIKNENIVEFARPGVHALTS
jgi:hypothetical protein